jgi:hypothetical protein
MTNGQFSKDLFVLVADNNMKFAVKGILGRPDAIKIRELRDNRDFICLIHPEHDPGCLRTGDLFSKPFVNQFAHALILFDREGSGQDTSARDMEAEVEGKLSRGWGDRAAAVVIDPELEIWVWSSSIHVDSVLGWKDRNPKLRDWLKSKGYLDKGQVKPKSPKEAMELALRTTDVPRSSSIYEEIAQKVSLERCTDPSFAKLKAILQKWFPVE